MIYKMNPLSHLHDYLAESVTREKLPVAIEMKNKEPFCQVCAGKTYSRQIDKLCILVVYKLGKRMCAEVN